MAFQFPWTNFHELNLDWFLSKFKQFTNNYLETTATAESVPYGTQPTVTVTGGELDDDTDIVDPFTFNFKIPAGQQGEQGEQGVPGTPGQDGFSPIATVTKIGSVATITITDKNGTSTTTISDGTVSIDQLNTKAPAILPTVSGVIANFSDGADDIPMSELTVDIIPSQSGSGTPAPDNIRPISGWTGCNVTRTGKNIAEFTHGKGIDTGGHIHNIANRSATVTPIKIDNTKQYKYVNSNGNSAIYAVWNGDTLIRRIAGLNSGAVMDTSGGDLLYVCGYSSNIDVLPETCGVFFADQYEEFEAYNASSLSLSWQSQAGTVYGGRVDVAIGVLTVTDGYIASYNGETLPSTWISDRDVYAPGTTPTTGAEVVYKLATPQTYQLTPQQPFNTWYGVNNVWSNTGDSTVTYTADTMLYIQNLTQPTEDDMVANRAIANGKFFMIGNNLYRATTAIASGSQIIPGTNATPMSLADALNLL